MTLNRDESDNPKRSIELLTSGYFVPISRTATYILRKWYQSASLISTPLHPYEPVYFSSSNVMPQPVFLFLFIHPVTCLLYTWISAYFCFALLNCPHTQLYHKALCLRGMLRSWWCNPRSQTHSMIESKQEITNKWCPYQGSQVSSLIDLASKHCTLCMEVYWQLLALCRDGNCFPPPIQGLVLSVKLLLCLCYLGLVCKAIEYILL